MYLERKPLPFPPDTAHICHFYKLRLPYLSLRQICFSHRSSPAFAYVGQRNGGCLSGTRMLRFADQMCWRSEVYYLFSKCTISKVNSDIIVSDSCFKLLFKGGL